jgi:predicted ATPase
MSRQALNLAEELSHPYSLGFALFFAAVLHKRRRETQRARERADAAIALASEQGFVRWWAGAMIMRGWALAEQGAREEGIAEIRQGLDKWRAMGGELGLPHLLSALAEAYGKGGQVEEGVRMLTEALALAHKNEEHRYESELYRLKGELLLRQCEGRAGTHPAALEAESCFRRALDIARYQQAKSLELRAVMSLSRLWQQQAKAMEARQMLVGIYSWFTEGFDTPDLQEARALLEVLA